MARSRGRRAATASRTDGAGSRANCSPSSGAGLGLWSQAMVASSRNGTLVLIWSTWAGSSPTSLWLRRVAMARAAPCATGPSFCLASSLAEARTASLCSGRQARSPAATTAAGARLRPTSTLPVEPLDRRRRKQKPEAGCICPGSAEQGSLEATARPGPGLLGEELVDALLCLGHHGGMAVLGHGERQDGIGNPPVGLFTQSWQQRPDQVGFEEGHERGPVANVAAQLDASQQRLADPFPPVRMRPVETKQPTAQVVVRPAHLVGGAVDEPLEDCEHFVDQAGRHALA